MTITVCGECGSRPVGSARYQASRGLCPTCYARLSRVHQLPPQPVPDRVVRDCQHHGAHEHGTALMYWSDRCRCAPCAAAYAAWRGTPKPRDLVLVDATRVREHCAALHAQGIPWTRIATTAGVRLGTLHPLVHGKRTWVTRDVETQLLQVRPTPTLLKHRTHLVDATPVRDHCAALHTHGVTWRRLAEAAQVSYATVYRVGTGRATVVSQDTATRLFGVTSVPPRRSRGDLTPYVSLRSLRIACGRTLDQVCTAVSHAAPHLHLTPGDLCAIEDGRRSASPDMLVALANAYGLDDNTITTSYVPRKAG